MYEKISQPALATSAPGSWCVNVALRFGSIIYNSQKNKNKTKKLMTALTFIIEARGFSVNGKCCLI